MLSSVLLQVTAAGDGNNFLLTKVPSNSFLISCTISCALSLAKAMPSTLCPPLLARRMAGGDTAYLWDLQKERDNQDCSRHSTWPRVLHAELVSPR